jgi:transcriptional regulator with AAA-type ATPase domain/NAD-dependent dihydropyrimidine dehydrogenase PreA subunit
MTGEQAERARWLKQQTPLGVLSDEVLGAIAQRIEIRQIKENYRLVLEDTLPDGLYILRSGRLESYRTSPDSLARTISRLPGSVLYLKELLLEQPAEQTTITLSDSELWVIPQADFLELVAAYPDINRNFSRQLAAELEQVSAQLVFEQERQTALRPYLMPKVKQGIVGSSRYAVRVRSDIRKASGDRTPVLIFGEPGLGKDNIAALIHFGSRDRKQPLVKLDCDTISANGAELFGREGGKPGLLAWVGQGTLMLNNVQDFPQSLRDRLVRLLEAGEYLPLNREGGPVARPRHTEARIILTAERTLPELERKGLLGHTIKVPPLRVTKADIEAQVKYYISLYCRARGLSQPTVAPEAIRRLQGYDFPGNLSELESLVERAITQSAGADVLTEEVFWSASSKARRFRINLLNAYPQLRQFLRSAWWPDRLNYGITLTLFAVVVVMLFVGPQSRDRNIALNLFWAWWWPLVLLIFPFLGRIWCAICPFMIYGEVAQWLSLKLFPRKLLPWPRQDAERVGGWFLFAMFTLILLWEELWNLENTAYLSSCLLLLITAGAVVFSLLFERRFWCRYLCPIGGMNGMFAKLSMIELRAQQGICSATCTTYQCYKGGPQKGEGMETGGCPVYSHPAQLQDNRDCVLCMTCLKACPHRSVEVNLRPPGIELWTTHKATAYEVSLLFLMFGTVLLHRLPEIFATLGWDASGILFSAAVPTSVTAQHFWWHAGMAIAILPIPALIALVAYGLLRLVPHTTKPRSFVELAYGYLPLVLAGNLAHFLRLGLTEAGRVLPVTFATFGLNGAGLPIVVAHPAVVAFLQGVTLLTGVLLSIVLTQKIARQPFLNLWPQHAATIAITVLFWHLILPSA